MLQIQRLHLVYGQAKLADDVLADWARALTIYPADRVAAGMSKVKLSSQYKPKISEVIRAIESDGRQMRCCYEDHNGRRCNYLGRLYNVTDKPRHYCADHWMPADRCGPANQHQRRTPPDPLPAVRVLCHQLMSSRGADVARQTYGAECVAWVLEHPDQVADEAQRLLSGTPAPVSRHAKKISEQPAGRLPPIKRLQQIRAQQQREAHGSG